MFELVPGSTDVLLQLDRIAKRASGINRDDQVSPERGVQVAPCMTLASTRSGDSCFAWAHGAIAQMGGSGSEPGSPIWNWRWGSSGCAVQLVEQSVRWEKTLPRKNPIFSRYR